MLQINKWYRGEAFSEDITKLILGIDFDKRNSVVRFSNMLMEPVIFDSITLGAGSHTASLKAD